MPKFAWQRYMLAELNPAVQQQLQQQRVKEQPQQTVKESLEREDEELLCPSPREEEGPLALVTRRYQEEPDEPSSSPTPSAPSSPPRTKAAQKAYDEPLDVSIKRKEQEERSSEEEEATQAKPLARYHPYIRPREEEQDAPINLEVPKKQQWRQAMASPPIQLPPEDQPLDFSQKRPCEPMSLLQRAKKDLIIREIRQRSLTLRQIELMRREPVKCRKILWFLNVCYEKYLKTNGCSNGGAPKQTGQHQQGATSGGSGGVGFPSTGGGSTGGSNHSSRSNSTDQEDSFGSTDTGFASMEFDFNESETKKWMFDNPELNPLKVLDIPNFKNEVTEQPPTEVVKPPDIGALDRETATFLQLAAPVPDPSATFQDIGTEFGLSFYEDDPFSLDQLLPSTFPQLQAQQQQQQQQPRLEHQLYPQQHLGPLNMSHQQPQQQLHRPSYAQAQQLTQNHLQAFQPFLPETSISLREPAPRREEERFPYIKEEAPSSLSHQLAEPKVDTSFFSPSAPISPATNNNKPTKASPPGSRKKSTSGLTDEEEDLLNIPCLQMRVSVLQQRYGIPTDAPLELINGGHGIKNPNVADLPDDKKGEKLPPMRCENDPSRFACRVCGKTFGLARLLNRHMKCHSDAKRYLCTFCGKGFNDTFDLKRHTRTHTGVRPYKCNLCEKSFTQRCSLESHCLKVHGAQHSYEYKQRRSKVYVCEDCGHTTKEPEVHYLHLKEQHPYSPALLKFYDKRHFKFNSSQLPFATNSLM